MLCHRGTVSRNGQILPAAITTWLMGLSWGDDVCVMLRYQTDILDHLGRETVATDGKSDEIWKIYGPDTIARPSFAALGKVDQTDDDWGCKELNSAPQPRPVEGGILMCARGIVLVFFQEVFLQRFWQHQFSTQEHSQQPLGSHRGRETMQLNESIWWASSTVIDQQSKRLIAFDRICKRVCFSHRRCSAASLALKRDSRF